MRPADKVLPAVVLAVSALQLVLVAVVNLVGL